MNDNTTLLDPTSEQEPSQRPRTKRPAGLQGLRIGLLDISKPRGDVFLDALESLLEAQDLTVARFAKPTYSRPAPSALIQQLARECDVVVEALAD